ncbi:NAD(P)/FAD-dependent oxidoreductase [Shimia sp. FJ5]|uniref:NAD(P)/FAD-dependent oxidoreductase n=1 Tax=Shimia sp. FJ5 TaxID=3079054 RepID=UPI00260EF142|nr:FAD-binding oxidoreductase [Shimia sp. FJ5]MDV4144726.1 FAD-binding oxidoreductase [Shimia sp. FJ5]
MTRICDPFVYGDGPVETCFWNETVDAVSYPMLTSDVSADVAIIGGGYTGLSAALHLAEAGRDVVLLDEQQPSWGASGRNGGFCCLGGSHIEPATLAKRIGQKAAQDYFLAERDAVSCVENILGTHEIDADTHSQGETLLAHRKRDLLSLEKKAKETSDLYGVTPELLSRDDLVRQGMNGDFHGGLTIPIGFALNPKKYALGLARAAQRAGARIHGQTSVTRISGQSGAFRLKTAQGTVSAKQVIIATNGYGRETVPNWLANRYMPAQSSVIVTRPLSSEEQEAQGWTSAQMAYDTRALLHYFRLMPDGRFLFGMRGGLRTTHRADQAVRRLIRRDFEQMFPAWSHVETPYYWSGFVCFARNLTPFAGPVPGHEGLFASFAYHGNGVAMASYCGALLAEQILEQRQLRRPKALTAPPGRFPGGRFRRLALWPAYLAYGLSDL